MFKIGVIGPSPGVKQVLNLTDDYKDDFKFIPCIYEEISDVDKIILKHQYGVDAWLCCGTVVYKFVIERIKIDKHILHLTITESGIYRAFIELCSRKNTLLKRLSVDTIMDANDFNGILQQTNVELSECYLNAFDTNFKYEDIVQFHANLWSEGKIEGVMTSLHGVYEQLVKKDVPVVWMTPTRMHIYETLKVLNEKIKASYFKEAQVSVVIIDIEQFDIVSNKSKTTYHLQYLELKIRGKIIQLCEKIKGSLIEKGDGRYMIFNTRGEIEREINSLQSLIQQLEMEFSIVVNAGVGFGKTVYSAEENGRLAIHLSKEGKKDRKIIIIQENGDVIEFKGKKQLKYSASTEDENLVRKLKAGHIGIKTYNKLVALIESMGWTSFTSKDLAIHMEMTERNARRIITDMHEAQLIKCIGEKSFSRGRPTKIYQLASWE